MQGAAVVALVINRAGDLLDDPAVTLMGLPDTDDEGEPMEDLVIKAIIGAVTSIPKARRKDKDLVGEAARRAARGEILERVGQENALQGDGNPAVRPGSGPRPFPFWR